VSIIGLVHFSIPIIGLIPFFLPEAYLDKFLLGKTDGKSTEFLRSKFDKLDREKWIPWTTPELK
jgi:hypothetical protein